MAGYTSERSLIQVVGGSYSDGPLIRRWTDIVQIDGINAGQIIGTTDSRMSVDKSLLAEVFINDPLALETGFPHPTYPATFLVSCSIEPVPGTKGPSPDSVRLTLEWEGVKTRKWVGPNGEPKGTIINSVAVNTYQIQEIHNYDNAGKLTNVYYQPNLAIGPTPSGQPQGAPASIAFAFKPRVADIRVPRIMRGFTVTQYENRKGQTVADLCDFDTSNEMNPSASALAFWNGKEIWGFGVGQLLFVGTSLSNNGTPICRSARQFMINERGWDKFFAVWNDARGLVPYDLGNLDPSKFPAGSKIPDDKPNGVGIFNMIPSDDFGFRFGGELWLPGKSGN